MSDQRTQRSWRKEPFLVALLALGTVVLAFGAVVGVTSLQTRADLRDRVVQRYADIWSAITRFQMVQGMQDELLSALEFEDALVYSLLLTQDIEGSLAVHVYDPQGRFLSGIPAMEDEADLNPETVRLLNEKGAWGRYLSEYESDLGSAGEALLELFISVNGEEDDVLALVRYEMEGSLVHEEFRSIDEQIATQASWAFSSGTLLVSAIFLLAFRKLQKANREAQERAKRLAEANAELAMVAKTSAIGAVASHLIHGLKNPLAGLTQHVASGGEGLEQDDWSFANQAAKRMQAMINDVVDVLKNDAFDDLETLSNEELGDFLRRKFDDRATAHGLVFSLHAKGENALSARVGNIAKLIASNLIDNAIDATPEGGRVDARIEERGKQVVFEIDDTGPGFSNAAKEALFSPSQSSKPDGAGIGLAISRQLARHIGAELVLVRSSPEGSQMRLSVPLSAE